MADRRNYYHLQVVTEDELDQGFTGLEQADWNLASDVGITGIISGATPVQHAPAPNLTIDLDGPARGYDGLGRRVFIGTDQVVDCSVDLLGVATQVQTPGNERYISLFARFARNLQDERTDGNSQQVYFVEDESFEIVVRAAPEAPVGAGTRVGLLDEELLVCDIKLIHGTTEILDADILVDRRQAWVFAAAGSISVDFGAWTVLSGPTVQDAFDSVDASLVDLGDDTDVANGAAIVGFEAEAGSPHSLVRGTTRAAVVALLGFINTHRNSWAAHQADHLEMAGAHGWLTAATIELVIQEIVDDLALSASAATCGTVRVGNAAMPGAVGGYDIPADTLRSHLASTWLTVSSHLAQTAEKHTAAGIINTPHGTVAAVNVQAAIDEIIDDLAATTGSATVGDPAFNGEIFELTAGTVAGHIEDIATWLDEDAGLHYELLENAVLDGAEMSDGGGLNMVISAAYVCIDGHFVPLDQATQGLPDNTSSFLIYDVSEKLYGYVAALASMDTGDILIGYAVTSGGAITSFADRRMLTTVVNRRGPIICGQNVPGAHFARLSDAVALLANLRTAGQGDVEILVAGECNEPTGATGYPKNALPIVMPDDDITIRGIPGRGLVRWSTDGALFELNGRERCRFVDLDIRFDGATNPGATQNRIVWLSTGGTVRGLTIQRCSVKRGASSKPCHGIYSSGSDDGLQDARIIDCDFESSDFGFKHNNPGGSGGIYHLQIRGCKFARVGTQGSSTAADIQGIRVAAPGANVVIRDNDITSFGNIGIYIDGDTSVLYGFRVAGNRIEDTGSVAIVTMVVALFGTIEGNILWAVNTAISPTAYGMSVDSERVVIIGNVIEVATGVGATEKALRLHTNSKKCVVMGNQFCGQGFDDNGTSNVVSPTFTDSGADTVTVTFNGNV